MRGSKNDRSLITFNVQTGLPQAYEEITIYNQGILDATDVPIYLRRKVRVTGIPEIREGKRRIIRLGRIEVIGASNLVKH